MVLRAALIATAAWALARFTDLSAAPLWVTVPYCALGLIAICWQAVPFERLLHRALRARGRLCSLCGYPVSHLDNTRHCPECGAPVDLRATQRSWRLIMPRGRRARLGFLWFRDHSSP